jgi:hypothetical protein
VRRRPSTAIAGLSFISSTGLGRRWARRGRASERASSFAHPLARRERHFGPRQGHRPRPDALALGSVGPSRRSNPPAAAASGGAVSAGAADTASLCRFLMRWLVGGGEGKGRGAAGVGESGAVTSAKAARRWERRAEGSGRRRARRAAGRHACRLRPATPNCRNALSHSERSGAHRR